MSTWILIIWFATNGNYSYVPVTVSTYLELGVCQTAGEYFVKAARPKLRPEFVCVPGPL